MEKRLLGRTGLDVGVVGIGTEYFVKPDRSEVSDIVHKAADNGVNYIDAMWSFPDVRDKLGAAIRGIRDRLVITGHLGAAMEGDQPETTRDTSKAVRYFHDLLTRLNTDYVDLVNIQNVDEEDHLDSILAPGGLLDIARQFKAEGKARHIGFSTHRVSIARRILDTGIVDMLMFPVNPAFDLLPGGSGLDQMWKDEIYDKLRETEGGGQCSQERRGLYTYCSRQGIGIVVMKTFAAGWLFAPYLYGGKRPLTPVQCIHYALSQPGVTTAVIGFGSVAELDAALAYANASDAEKDFVEGVRRLKWHARGSCMYCSHCLPCPVGIEIAEAHRILELAALGTTPELVERCASLAVSPSECLECGQCESRCPFGVPVASNMALLSRTLG